MFVLNDEAFGAGSGRNTDNGGWLEWWEFMFQCYLADVVARVSAAGGSAAAAIAAQAAAEAAAALSQVYAAALRATSTSSHTIGTGSKVFAIGTGKQFEAGQWVMIKRAADATKWMSGPITSYTGGNLTVAVDATDPVGGGPYTDWVVMLSGPRGAVGLTGAPSLGRLVVTSAGTLGLADKGKLVVLEGSSSYTLALDAVGTLTDGWYAYVRHIGTGTVTLDPSGSETINGATTLPVKQGQEFILQCNGSNLRTYGLVGELLARDEKSSGTHGGTASAAAASVRTLNTLVHNSIPGASLASNKLTLPAGRYDVEAIGPAAGNVGATKAYLYNQSDSAVLWMGSSAYCAVSTASAESTVLGSFVLAAQKDVELRQYFTSTAGTTDMGRATSDGNTEVYGSVRLKWRPLA